MLSPEQLLSMLLTYKTDIDEAQKAVTKSVHEEAEARKALTQARARAWSTVEGRNEDIRKAKVENETVEERFRLDIATGAAKAALEQIRNKRQQLSAMQTYFNAYKEEALFTRTGQDEDFDERYVQSRAP